MLTQKVVGSTLIRPNDTTTYAISDQVAGTTPAVGTFDLSFCTARGCKINHVFIHSTQNASPTTASFALWLFNSTDNIPTLDADNAPVTWTAAILTDFQALIAPIATRTIMNPAAAGSGSNIYTAALTTESYTVYPNPTTGILYYLIQIQNAYVPIALEAFTPILTVEYL